MANGRMRRRGAALMLENCEIYTSAMDPLSTLLVAKRVEVNTTGRLDARQATGKTLTVLHPRCIPIKTTRYGGLIRGPALSDKIWTTRDHG